MAPLLQRTLTFILSASLLASCGHLGVPSAPAELPMGGLGHVAPANAPIVGGCQIFPANNSWNTDISKYPVDPLSARYIAALPGNLHPDFGREPSLRDSRFNIVPAHAEKSAGALSITGRRAIPGRIRFRRTAQIEGGPHSSRVIATCWSCRQGTCKLYEMFDAYPIGHGESWRGRIWARSFRSTPTSCGQTAGPPRMPRGLPMFPAPMKCAEVKAGVIDHALRK